MNTHFRSLMAAVFAAGAVCASAAETPVITLKTNIYDYYGAENSFHIVLGTTETDFYDVDCGFGMVEAEVSQAYFDTETSTITGTAIQCRVSEEGLVKIYGDPTKIDYLDCEGCYLEWIDIDQCVNLDIIDLQHNELKRLDLSPFTKLSAIYLSDNPFTAETPLVVGSDHPYLQILELDIIDHLDQSFNLSDYPALVSFDGYHNMDLRHVDPSGCPNLQVMSLELTPVETLDVSKNANLVRLNVNDTRIRTLDLSQNKNLSALYWQHTSGTINTDVKIDAVDVSANTNLTELNVAGNDLTSIDLTNNPYLLRLSVRSNRLTTIDLSRNTYLVSVDLALNDFTFATLPVPQDTWSEYYYDQHNFPCAMSYQVGKPVDFSSSVLRTDGTTTTVQVYENPLDKEPQLLSEDYYSYADGVVTFNQAPADSVYIKYANSAFAEYTLRTDYFKVKTAEQMGQPDAILSFTPDASLAGQTITFRVGLDRATAEAPRTFTVDTGNPSGRITCSATTVTAGSEVSVTLPAAVAPVTLYLDEGEVLTAFEITGVALASVDVTAARELRTLCISDCGLENIDMRYNRCLTDIVLSGNNLSTLSLAGIYGNYEKFALRSLDASRNRLTDLEVVNCTSIRSLNLSHNLMSDFSLKNYDYMEHLDISYNLFTEEANLAYMGNARTIDISHNGFSTALTVDMPYLEKLDIRSNNFTLATLPHLPEYDAATYLYAPQAPLEIVAYAPAVNISEQNREIDGNGTTFTWLRADGTPLTAAEVSCEAGATRFLDTTVGTVYCVMEHPAFPAFTGENRYVTTFTTVVDAPTEVVASFTTTKSTDQASVVFRGNKKTALYIDWRGDGTEYKQYPVEANTYIEYAGEQTYKDANVKIYTYEDASDITVFSIYNAPMTNLDASKLTGLTAFSIGDCDIDEQSIVMPATKELTEINFIGNRFSTMDFADYKSLKMLNISRNSYETFDASAIPSLEILYADANNLSELKLGNPTMWGLSVNTNPLSSLDFSSVPSLAQFTASGCQFSTIDLSPVARNLTVLCLDHNRFRFSTLPRVAQLPSLYYFTYGFQADVEVEHIDGVIDLSSEASVNGISTTYTWYMGDITEDEDTGELVGETLLGPGSEDPEYLFNKGVTTFRYTFVEPLRCVLTNLMYPNLTLYTTPVMVEYTGIESVAADASEADATAPVDVYTVGGMLVRHAVAPSEATRGLAPGIYIVGGRKVAVR